MNAPTPQFARAVITTSDQLWYKDAIIYQLHVKSFFDANNDGVGDFPGLISKLDYIADLGVNTIWLLPFYPSPRFDDGYDISDYRDVHPEYGKMADVKQWFSDAMYCEEEAHGPHHIQVLTEWGDNQRAIYVFDDHYRAKKPGKSDFQQSVDRSGKGGFGPGGEAAPLGGAAAPPSEAPAPTEPSEPGFGTEAAPFGGAPAQLLAAQNLMRGAGGVAVLGTRAKLSPGSHTLHAHYDGDTNWAAGDSPNVTLVSSSFTLLV